MLLETFYITRSSLRSLLGASMTGKEAAGSAFNSPLKRSLKNLESLFLILPLASDVKFQPNWLGRQLNCFKVETLDQCRAHFVQYQRWKHKTWNNATRFDQTYVEPKLWYKER
jgi:hypothetical protein